MAYSGSEFVIQLENVTPGTYTTIGGGKSASVSFSGGPQTVNDFIGQVSELCIPGTAVNNCTVSGGGVFTDSAKEQIMLDLKLSGASANFRILFGNSEDLVGEFYVTQFSRSGDMSSPDSYTFSMTCFGVT